MLDLIKVKKVFYSNQAEHQCYMRESPKSGLLSPFPSVFARIKSGGTNTPGAQLSVQDRVPALVFRNSQHDYFPIRNDPLFQIEGPFNELTLKELCFLRFRSFIYLISELIKSVARTIDLTLDFFFILGFIQSIEVMSGGSTAILKIKELFDIPDLNQSNEINQSFNIPNRNLEVF